MSAIFAVYVTLLLIFTAPLERAIAVSHVVCQSNFYLSLIVVPKQCCWLF